MVTYTMKELEPILKRKAKTIKEYINYGGLNATKLNGRYLITEEDLKEFLESKKILKESKVHT